MAARRYVASSKVIGGMSKEADFNKYSSTHLQHTTYHLTLIFDIRHTSLMNYPA
jgi:hypothetical protein